MDRRVFFATLAGGLIAAGTLVTSASAAPTRAVEPGASAPIEMQWGYGYGRRRYWGGRPYGFYGPRPWGPPPMRRCWINRWGERVCRF